MKITSYLSIVIFSVGLLILSKSTNAKGNPGLTNPDKSELDLEVALTQLNGLIVDEKTGESIAGAEIFLNNKPTGIYSDFEGNFKLEDIPVGNYNLKVEFISYKDKVINDLHLSTTLETLVIKL